MHSTSLTFNAGKFSLSNFNGRLDHPWILNSARPREYDTVDLQAAAAFRPFADEIAERVFTRAFQSHYDVPGQPPLDWLDPPQRDGVRWALARKRSYLAHAPGAGKTAEAVAVACVARAHGQALFIVPPTLTVNWEREIMKFTAPFGIFPTIGIVGRSAQQNETPWRADFLIVPDSMLTKPWVYERLWKRKSAVIAVDEASRFKEPSSQRSRVFYGGWIGELRHPGLFQSARHVVFLDGSPMPNRTMELWAPTYALHPEAIDCMGAHEFGMRYGGPTQNYKGGWEFKHSSNEDELRARLQKDFMHVVTEAQLNHPERRRSLVFMNQDVRSAEHKTWEKKHLGSAPLEQLTEDESQGDLARFRRELGVKKVPWIAKYARERLESSAESILLFVWHREVAHALLAALTEFNPGLVVGGTPERDRERYFEEFQSGKRPLIIGNIQAMGRGHNLQRASRVIFGEYSWTDELNRQCEKRASRRGSERQFVRCEYVVCPGSMDERILTANFTKERRVKKVIG